MMTICLTVVRTTKLLSMHLHQINQKNVKRMTWKACQRVFLESVSEGLSESVSHRVSESVSDRKSESVRDRALKSIRDRVSNSVAAETVVGSGSEGLSERISNNVSDSVSQAVGGGGPELYYCWFLRDTSISVKGDLVKQLENLHNKLHPQVLKSLWIDGFGVDVYVRPDHSISDNALEHMFGDT